MTAFSSPLFRILTMLLSILLTASRCFLSISYCPSPINRTIIFPSPSLMLQVAHPLRSLTLFSKVPGQYHLSFPWSHLLARQLLQVHPVQMHALSYPRFYPVPAGQRAPHHSSLR